MKPFDGFVRSGLSAAALFALCAVVVPVPVPARAQSSEPIALEWNAPSGCSGTPDILHRVQKLAGSSTSAAAQLRAEATITRNDDGRLHLKLIVRAGNLIGERNIDGRSCEDLAGATAVVLALLLHSVEPLSEGDLTGREQHGRNSSGGEPAGTSSPKAAEADQPLEAAPISREAKPQPEPTQRASDDARSTLRWRPVLQVPLVSVGFGPLPQASVGFAFAGGVLLERWTLLAEARASLSQKMTANDHPELGADMHLIEASLRSCRAMLLARLELAPCLRVSLEHISARGSGAHIAPRTAETTWVAAGLGAQARLHVVEWFSLVGGADAQIEVARPRISVDGVGSIGQLRPAALTITIGSEWIF